MKSRLEGRRVIEDPLFRDSSHCQWTQMADLVAWTTYQKLLGHPAKKFAAVWFVIYNQNPNSCQVCFLL